MPNHFHGIIRLLSRGEMGVDMDVGVGVDEGECNSPLQPPPATATMGKGELHSPLSPASTPPPEMVGVGGVFKTPLRSPSQTVGAIVRGYKSAVTKQLGLLGFNGKFWQRNYYEHIIRNEQSYQRISAYIVNNPSKWLDDTFYGA
jgi:putative transposase